MDNSQVTKCLANEQNESKCSCYNCEELAENISECGICVEPFQDNGISSCHTCGNLMCWTCAQKLITCPYCRVSIVYPWQRNTAMEKLLKKLKLPCRYSKRGCMQHILDSDRTIHERSCEFSPMKCPLSPSCTWRGDMDEMAQHLKQVHSLVLLKGDHVTIEIAGLKNKIKETEQNLSKYVVILRCHSEFFLCKIVLFERMLKIDFLEVAANDSKQNKHQKFAAWLEVFNTVTTVKSIVEISNNLKFNDQFEISCDTLLKPRMDPAANFLKILINIRPNSDM